MKIRTRLSIGFGTQVLLATILGVTALLGMLLVERQFSFVVEHDAPVIANARHLSKLVIDMETGQRGFCLTRQRVFLEPYDSGVAAFPILVEEQRRLVVDNPAQVAALNRIERLVETWRKEAAVPEIEMAERVADRGSPNEEVVSLSDVAAMLQAGTGKTLLDEIREEFDAFIEIELGLTADRYRIAQATTKRVRWLTIGLLLLAILVGAVVALIIGRAVSRSLVKVTEGAKAVGSGNLDAHLDIGSPDEVGDLARAFNAMALKLRASAVAREQAEHETRKIQESLSHVARLNTMGEMATNLAHELNQPLTAIANYCYVGEQQLSLAGSPDRVQLAELFQKLSTLSIRSGSIIARLRALVDKRESIRTVVGMGKPIQEVVRLLDPSLRQGEIDVELDLQDPEVTVVIDEIQIQQVLVNLIRNAMDAMSETTNMDRALRITTSGTSGSWLEVGIEDTGPGILAPESDRIFDAFFTSKPEGMGMGLSISRTIIESHGGRLWMSPNPHCGVTFRFTLPIASVPDQGGEDHPPLSPLSESLDDNLKLPTPKANS